MKIQYLAKSFLQDYKISYMNDFQDYYILQIFFHPSYDTKNFLLPYFRHIPICHQILI